MEESLLFQQMIYQSRLEHFDTELINYLDVNIDRVLHDLENKYVEGQLAFLSSSFPELDKEDLKYKTIISNLSLEDNIVALLETKIIYLWKIFEVKLKELIQTAYNVETTDFYKFDSIVSFLKKQGINITAIKDYNNIVDLLKVNNQCKHEGLKWCEKINHIKEFTKKNESDDYIKYINAELFYLRIRNIPETFLVSLKELIIEDRLSFDRNKYKEIAKPLVERMNHQQAIEFMEVFLDIYNLKPAHLTNTKNDTDGVYLESL